MPTIGHLGTLLARRIYTHLCAVFTCPSLYCSRRCLGRQRLYCRGWLCPTKWHCFAGFTLAGSDWVHQPNIAQLRYQFYIHAAAIATATVSTAASGSSAINYHHQSPFFYLWSSPNILVLFCCGAGQRRCSLPVVCLFSVLACRLPISADHKARRDAAAASLSCASTAFFASLTRSSPVWKLMLIKFRNEPLGVGGSANPARGTVAIHRIHTNIQIHGQSHTAYATEHIARSWPVLGRVTPRTTYQGTHTYAHITSPPAYKHAHAGNYTVAFRNRARSVPLWWHT